MGAWGSGVFENDDAADWVWELEDDTDASVLIGALSDVADLDDDEYIEAPEACNALAAAEIVAAARGHHGVDLPSEARAWIGRNAQLVDQTMVALAATVVERIVTDSELKDLWDEAGDSTWSETVTALAARLR